MENLGVGMIEKICLDSNSKLPLPNKCPELAEQTKLLKNKI